MTNTIKLYKHLSELSVYLSNTQRFTPPLDFWGSGKPPCCSPFHSYSLLMRKRRYPVVSIHRHFPSPGEVRAACAQLPMAAHQGSLHRRRRWNQRSMVENGGRIHRRQCPTAEICVRIMFMKQRFILFVSTLVLSIFFGCYALAYDVKVDGIYYNLDENNKTVEVTNREQYPYSGVIVIPSSINSERVRLWCNKYWILCFLVLQWLEITDISPERLLMEDGKTIFNVSFKRDRSFRVTGEIIMDPAKAIPVKQFADSCDKREWPPCYWWESQGQAYRPKVWTKVLFMGHPTFRVIDCR